MLRLANPRRVSSARPPTRSTVMFQLAVGCVCTQEGM